MARKKRKKGFFHDIYHKDKTGKKIAVFALKLTLAVFALFLTTATLAFALISQDGDKAYYDYSYFGSGQGISATSTSLALSGRSITKNEQTAYGVFGYSFSGAYSNIDDKSIVGDAVGVYGQAIADNGYPASGGNVYGLWGDASVKSISGANATGVYGKVNDEKGSAKNAFGIRGEVYDVKDAAQGNYYGLYGLYSGEGKGFGVYGEVSGKGLGSAAIYGKGEKDNYAGYFQGRVKVKGDLVLESLEEKKGTICSREGSIYYNTDISELCFCNGANWMKVAATSTLCY